jgi:hypothetical protein
VFLESIALIGGFLATSWLGLPLVAFLARPEQWLTNSEENSPERILPSVNRAAFEPLNLGPDLMKWPSEVARPSTASPLPEWPSLSWNDTHFGSFHKHQSPAKVESRAVIAEARREVLRQHRETQQAPAKSEADDIKLDGAHHAPTPQQAAPSPLNAAAEALLAEVPSPAELEAMVGSIGLAGTVQEIMKRTNWDFRRAAHYLAKARQRR